MQRRWIRIPGFAADELRPTPARAFATGRLFERRRRAEVSTPPKKKERRSMGESEIEAEVKSGMARNSGHQTLWRCSARRFTRSAEGIVASIRALVTSIAEIDTGHRAIGVR